MTDIEQQNKRRKIENNYYVMNLEEILEKYYSIENGDNYNKKEIIRYINDNYNITSYLYSWSIRYNCPLTVRFLIENHIIFYTEYIYEAIKSCNFTIVKFLIEGMVITEDKVMYIILQYAASYGSVDIFIEIYTIFYKSGRLNYKFKDALYDAIKCGNVEIVKYLYGYWKEEVTNEHMEIAIQYGQLDIIKYFKEILNNTFTNEHIIDILWNEEIELESKKLDIIKYFIHDLHVTYTKDLFDNAVESANLEIVKYLHMLGNNGSTTSLELAMEFGHLEIVKYLYEVMEIEFTDQGMYEAFLKNFMDIIEYAYSKGKKCSKSMLNMAYNNNYKQGIEFLLKHGVSEE